MRIVSLLPSTTEILFGLGAGDDVVGVTFECDFPAEARSRRIVSTSAMPEGLSPRDIDTFVGEALRRGEDLYRLQADALTELDADLVVTQDLCAVCAVDVSTVDDALAILCFGRKPAIASDVVQLFLQVACHAARTTGHLDHDLRRLADHATKAGLDRCRYRQGVRSRHRAGRRGLGGSEPRTRCCGRN